MSAPHQPNLALTRLVKATGAAKKSLAFRLNQVAETASPTDRQQARNQQQRP